ncbi:MAG TPA: alpha-mannosidase [Ktedonobacterales bacterium]
MNPSTSRIRRGLADLAIAIYRAREPLEDLRMLPIGDNVAPMETPIPSLDAAGWVAIAPGGRWGGQDQNVWFHGKAHLPENWREPLAKPGHSLALRLLLGESPDFGWPEGLLYVNGSLLQGINQHHPDVLLPTPQPGDSALAFDVRAWSGIKPGDHRLEYAEIALLNRDLEALYHLLVAGVDLVDALDEREPLREPLFAALQDAYDALDLRLPEDRALDDTGGQALDILRARLAELRATHDPAYRPRITAIGHGHLDVAWLWETRHTREKAARTFSVATALMAHYPEYHFLHTTPQVFDWLSRDYPEVFARVRERVEERRFESAGAMWLESDTNLISGESLVRQIYYGQRYLRETFGSVYDTLWLPDTFGYTYALPQIMLKSGIRAFMTTKMSWSDTNRLPHDTFRWRGLDGSETLAHFVTTPWLSYNSRDTWVSDTDTYNGRLDVTAVRKLWERYRSKAANQELLLIYGYGDGGAGPTRQLIESFLALVQLPGMPDLRLGRADDYFHALRERVWSNPALPVWDGELYLEYHRGVYTTHGWLKRLHRRNEERLSHAESLDAQRWALAIQAEENAPDERSTLDEMWRVLLLHEFHDILPGSSIAPVYEDARRDLTGLAERLDAFIERAARDITRLAGIPTSVDVIYNPSPLPLPSGGTYVNLQSRDATREPAWRQVSQEIETLSGGRALLLELRKMGGRDWRVSPTDFPDTNDAVQLAPPTASRTPDGGAALENPFLRLTLDARGAITSLLDKREPGGREVIPTGARANVFMAFDDRPQTFDAWDIDAGYDRKAYACDDERILSVSAGPLRVTARVQRTLLNSVITQDISLYRDSPRIDFATHIDWHEHHLLLKVAFPLDLRVTEARSEIQYGSITRPTHRNTSWDEARFETAAHRWVDLSEVAYGVALLNDGKYGYDIHDATIRLTLLRSPTLPDPNTDQGAHDVTYSLLPHPGAWPAGEVVEHGYALNRPPMFIFRAVEDDSVAAQPATSPRALFTLRNAGAVIEAIKRSADGEGLMVRVYEATGARHAAHISSSVPLASVIETDLLERPMRESPAFDLWRDSPVASHDEPQLDREPQADQDSSHLAAHRRQAPRSEHTARGWSFALRPFEVRTFRVILARQ